MKNTKKKKKNKYIFNKITFILFTICNIYLIINILSFVGIEDIIRYIIIAILLLINIIFFIRLKSKNITTSVIMIILSIIFLFISYNANKVLNIINNFSKDKVTYSTSLVTLKENNLKLNTIKTIGILNDETSIDGNILPNKVIKENNLNRVTIKKYDQFIHILNDLYDNKIDAGFLPSNYVTSYNSIDKYTNISKETSVLLTKNQTDKTKNATTSNKKLTEPFTLLIMGVDSEADELAKNASFNGDALILVTFNPNTLNATMLSIPRDTYVPIACFKNQYENKITHAAWQGAPCMMKTIENFLDIKIDYYVKINFKGVVDLVDTLKGIEVDVPYNFCEQDSKRRFGKHTIYVEKGIQTLNGEQVLALARHRKETPEQYACGKKYLGNTLSDVIRGQNQQLIIKGILNKAKTLNNLNDVYSILETISKNMDTNMSTKTILSLYDIFMDVVSKKSENTEAINIERLYLSGYEQYIYDENMQLTLYNYIYYRGSRDDIKKEMKINLGLIDPELIKTFTYTTDEEYEKPLIGRGNYKIVDYIETLPNFKNKSKTDVISWANKHNINVTFKEEESSIQEGLIINQNYPYGYRVKNIKNNLIITVSKHSNTNVVEEVTYYDCTLEENKDKNLCLFPNFTDKTLLEFKNWYNKLTKYNINIPSPTYIKIDENDPQYNEAKKGMIVKQNIKPNTTLSKIDEIVITYIEK